MMVTAAPPTGWIFDIRRYSLHDGPGIRTTVFLKGCPLDCWWCHNPESQSPQPEIIVREHLCAQCGECVRACPQGAVSMTPQGPHTDPALCTRCGECVPFCAPGAREQVGQRYSPQALADILARDIPFFDQSGGGVTFSGGEPLLQAEFLSAALAACKRLELRTAVDTSGFAPWPRLEGIAPQVDLFLYDLKVQDEAAHRRFTGVSNQLILENLRRLNDRGSRIIVRLPVIPGLNDTPAEAAALGSLCRSLDGIQRVDLLPYHHTAAAKYQRLGREYRLPDTPTPSPDHLNALAQQLRAYGIAVQIGG